MVDSFCLRSSPLNPTVIPRWWHNFGFLTPWLFFTLNALNFQSPVNLHRVNIHRYFCRSYIYEGGGRCWYTNNRLRQQEDSIIHISIHTAVNSSPVSAKDQLQNTCCSPKQDTWTPPTLIMTLTHSLCKQYNCKRT